MAQILVPVSDEATGSWTVTPLWSKVDDDSTVNATGDDTTISSDNNTAPDNADFGLSSGSDPAVSTDHVLRALWSKDGTGGHAITGVLELWEGVPDTGTLIATLSVTDVGATEVEDTYTLSGAEADSISDYSNLYLRLSRQGDTGGQPATRRSLVVDLVELEIPDAGAVTHEGSLSVAGTGSVTLEGQREAVGSLSVAGVGSVSLEGQRTTFGDFTVVGQATITLEGEIPTETKTGTLSVAGQSSVSVEGTRTTFGAVSIPGVSSLTLEGQRTAIGSVAISGQSSTTVEGQREALSALSVDATSVITIEGEVAGQKTGSLSIPASSDIAISGQRETFGDLAVPGSTAITISGVREAIASLVIEALSAISVEGEVQGAKTATMTVAASSEMSIDGQRETFGAIVITGESVIMISGETDGEVWSYGLAKVLRFEDSEPVSLKDVTI